MNAKVETKNTAKKFATPHEQSKSKAKATKPAKVEQVDADISSTSEKKAKAAAAKAKPAKVRTGKLGSVLGHSVVSVIRCFGKNGWTFEDAQAALVKAGISPALHTLKVGLRRGRDGQKRIAPLSAKELDTLKVKKATKGKGNSATA